MKKYCGKLHQVTEPEFLKQAGQGLTIDTIQIGNKTLRKVKISSETALFLKPEEKRDVCLYIFYLLFTPNILGMKYTDTGEKHLVPGSFIRGSFIRYAVVCTIVFPIAGALLCGFLGNVAVEWMGIESLADTSTAGYGAVGGLGLAWYYAVRVVVDYMQARAA